VCEPRFLEKAIHRKVAGVNGVLHKSKWIDRPPVWGIGTKKVQEWQSKPIASTTMEMGTKKNMRMLREAWAESNPAHCNERRRGKTRRGDTKHGFCANWGWSWNRIHVCKQRLKRKMKRMTRRRGEGGGFKLDEAKIRVKGKI
jgi:hypothetical protein